MIIRSEFCDLYAHAQSISLLWCEFQTITLKTEGGVGETMNSTIKCDGRVHRCMTEGKTICHPSLCGSGIKIWRQTRAQLFKHRYLNELISGQNVNCSSKNNM